MHLETVSRSALMYLLTLQISSKSSNCFPCLLDLLYVVPSSWLAPTVWHDKVPSPKLSDLTLTGLSQTHLSNSQGFTVGHVLPYSVPIPSSRVSEHHGRFWCPTDTSWRTASATTGVAARQGKKGHSEQTWTNNLVTRGTLYWLNKNHSYPGAWRWCKSCITDLSDLVSRMVGKGTPNAAAINPNYSMRAPTWNEVDSSTKYDAKQASKFRMAKVLQAYVGPPSFDAFYEGSTMFNASYPSLAVTCSQRSRVPSKTSITWRAMHGNLCFW